MFEASQHARESLIREIGAGFFGEYLVSQGLVSREELGSALEAQKKLASHLKIGELLVQRGALDARALVKALQDYGIGIRMGELLIHQGDIGFLQLLEALDRQQTTGCQLGTALVALGHCRPDQIEEVLALQQSLQNLGEAEERPSRQA